MGRISFVMLLFPFALCPVQAGDAETERLRRAFAFSVELLERRVTGNDSSSFHPGDAAFNRRKAGQSESDDDKQQAIIMISKSRDGAELTETFPFPATSDTQMTKVKVVDGRQCSIDYLGSAVNSEIEAITEGPGANAAEFVNGIGGGALFGCFLAPELPPIEELWGEQWSTTPTGELSCYYGDRRIKISFDPDDQNRPTTVEVNVAVKGLEKTDDSYVRSSLIEYRNWTTQEGVEFPAEVDIWELRMSSETGWVSTHYLSEIVSVSPPVEVSDRYGDFFTDVPSGTPVQVNDYMGIDFIWQDGEIVRKIDGVKLASLIGQPFFGSPLRRFIIMGLGFLGLALVGGIVWRLSGRLRDKPSSTRRF
jgi:hypothetical protein